MEGPTIPTTLLQEYQAGHITREELSESLTHFWEDRLRRAPATLVGDAYHEVRAAVEEVVAADPVLVVHREEFQQVLERAEGWSLEEFVTSLVAVILLALPGPRT